MMMVSNGMVVTGLIALVFSLVGLICMGLYARDMRLGWLKESKVTQHWIDSYRALQEARDNLLGDLRQIAAEKGELVACHARALDSMGEARLDVFKVSEKLREANGRCTLLERRVGPLQNDNAKLRERAESAENAHNKLSYQYDKLQQELNKLKLEVKVTT